jgi:geranylgeranyl pyrophosphate synthase
MSGEVRRTSDLSLPYDDTITDFLGNTTDTLHDFILCRLPELDTPLASAALHHFAVPGKMVRAKMALRAANLLKIDVTAALHWAVAIEVLHNASLIHDDICDGDKLRRDRPSVWSLYGQNVALTLGDWLIALAFELAAEAGQRSQTPLLVKILAQHMATTTAGEAAEFSTQTLFNWDNYLTIAADKTAPLLTAPLEGVAAMALHPNASAAISMYFRSLGTAYQIANDILNFRALDGAADCASDLARRAPNAVIVLYRQNLTSLRANAFDDWFLSDDNADLCIWQQQILKSDAMALSAHHMHKTLDQAVRYAQVLPAGLAEVIAPVQALLKEVCLKSVAPVNC